MKRIILVILFFCTCSFCYSANLNGTLTTNEYRGDCTIIGETTINEGTVIIISGNLKINRSCDLNIKGTLIVEGKVTNGGNIYANGNGVMIAKKDWDGIGGIYANGNSSVALMDGYNGVFVPHKNKITNLADAKNVYAEGEFGYADTTQSAYKKAAKVLKDYSTLLPITLNYFTASQYEEEIHFEWQTAAEVNNDFFTVEYSIDGVNFNELLRENGNGTTSQTNDYSATISANDFFGITYFRLKQTDFNGEFSYSDIQILNVSNSESVSIYPSRNSQTITISGDFEQISFCDTYGKTISLPQLSENSFSTNSLIPGIHYVIVSTNNKKQVLPFVKQ